VYMKIRMRLRLKLLLAIISVTIIIFWASISFLTNSVDEFTRNNIHNYIKATTEKYANEIRVTLDGKFNMAKALAHGFYNYSEYTPEQIKSNTLNHLYGIALENPDILSVWASWEYKAIDPNWENPYGRVRLTYLWENGELKKLEEDLNLDGDNTKSLYYILKTQKREALVDPYWFTYTGSNKKVLETSICVPLVKDSLFSALFGFDIELTYYQKLVNEIKPYNNSFAVLISENGTIVAHPDSSVVGIFADSVLQNGKLILSELKKDKEFSTNVSIENNNYYVSFSSFKISNAPEKWHLGIYVPEDVIEGQIVYLTRISRMVMLLGLLILALIIWFIAFSITRPLVKATNVLSDLSLGKIDPTKKLSINSGDEIEDIGNSINILIDSLDKTAHFAKEIGKGNLNASYQKLSDNDVLGEALLEMRKSLEHAKKIDEERKLEENKNRWFNEGVAKFAEILRRNSDNLADFSYDIIYNLTKYVDATIGAIFLINDDDPQDKFIELMATYAYERRKYEEKKINIGEGLVGRCVQEAETIYMTEVPKGYFKIASGLGEQEPSTLLLVPMKVNDVVFGVIEMASFEPIEDYKINFITKIGENIAATISSVKINIKTAKLLEESKLKSEELAAQEEEMRQNMEELQATQEESARKSAEMQSLINALHSSSYVIEYDINGNVINVNEAYLALTGQNEKDIIGTHHADNLQMTEEQKSNYQRFWQDLRNGIIKKETSKVSIGGTTFTFIETYSPIYDENRKVIKILKIAHNITDFINEENDKRKKKGK